MTFGGFLWLCFLAFAIWYGWKKWGRAVFMEDRVGPSPKDDAGGRWNFNRLVPKHVEPTAVDILVAKAPKVKDPFGNTKDREVRRILDEIKSEEPWQAVDPSGQPTCNMCLGERLHRNGVLVCPLCDHHEDNRKELIA